MSGIKCELCPHNCIITEGKTGICGVRTVEDSRIRLRTYGKFSAIHIDPIEKKPLYHVQPGRETLSLGSIGCNLRCPWCQNWSISRKKDLYGLSELSPEALLELCHSKGLTSVSFTYNEPIITYEYVKRASELLKDNGIDTYIVSAGYISDKYRADFFKNVKAANIDLKSFNSETYKKVIGGKLKHILDTLKYLYKSDTWLEITTLIVPGINDSTDEIRKMSEWIKSDLGSHVPLHLSAFYPTYKMTDRSPTPPEVIIRGREIALEAGLKYVYTGNITDINGSVTYCPECNTSLIEREGFTVKSNRMISGKCPKCECYIEGLFDK